MTVEFFAGFAIGAFTSFTISVAFFAHQWHKLYEENQSLRRHPLQGNVEPKLELLGEWGSAVEGYVDE